MCREEICSRFPIPKWFSFIQQTHTRRAVEKLKVIERQTTKTRTFQGGQSCKLFNTFSVWLSILAFWTLARQNTWLCNGCRAMLQETAKWHSIDNKHQHTDNISFFSLLCLLICFRFRSAMRSCWFKVKHFGGWFTTSLLAFARDA